MAARSKVVIAGAIAALVAIAIIAWRTRTSGSDAPADPAAQHGSGPSGDGSARDADRRGGAVPIAKRPGLRVAGVVVTESGTPVKGAAVRIGSTRRRIGVRGDAVMTDDAGRFDLGTQPIDQYVVTADRTGVTPAEKVLDLRDPTARPDQLRLVLYPCTASIHGTIRDSGGGEIEGATVMRVSSLVAAGGGAVSGAGGRYELCLPPGNSFVLVRADGYAAVFDRASAFGKTRLDFTLSPGASLAGRIVRAGDGAPVDGAIVAISGQDRTRLPVPLHAITDDEGRFEVDGLSPGLQEITATGPGVASARPCEAEALIGQTGEVVCEVEATWTIAGKLVERGGGPLAGVTVRMVTTAPLGAPPEYDRTQRDGTFLIENVLPGEYRPFVEDTDQQFDAITVEHRDVAGIVLEVERRSSIAGRVLYGGKPVAGASVQLQNSGRGETTDDDGAYVFRRIPAGTYQVYAESQRVGAFTKGPSVTIGASEQRTGVDLELELSGSIAGVVVDQNDRPVPGVYLAFSLIGGRDFGFATTADDGTFMARALSGGGEYALEVRDRPGSGVQLPPGSGKRFPRFAVLDGQTHLTGVKIQIRWERLAIAGRITDAAGQPAPDVSVEALAADAGWMRAPAATSDQNGAFAIRDLPAGKYTVRAEGPTGGTTQVENIAAGRSDLALRLSTPGSLDGTLVGFTDPPEIIAYATDRGRIYRATVAGTKFRIAQLPAGPYLVRAVSNSGGTMDNLRIEAGKRATLTLTNLGVGVVKGTVRDEKTGEPVAGLRCWMTGQSPDRRAPPTTDAAGSFTLESAPGGMHDLTCYGPQRYASQQITVRPGSVLTVELLARDTSKPRTEGESGMTLDTLQNDVIVATVAAGGPAARAGVKPGDILTAIDGKKLDGRARIAELAIERRAPGTKVKLGLERDDKELTVELTLDAASP